MLFDAQDLEQLEYSPAELKVIEHIGMKYACRQCEEHVAIAARPPPPIAKGLSGPGLLAQTVLSQSGDHLPLYRQEDILLRHGVVIRRSTLCDWIAAAADLAAPLYERIGMSRHDFENTGGLLPALARLAAIDSSNDCATLDGKADVSPPGDVKCTPCDRWFNIHCLSAP